MMDGGGSRMLLVALLVLATVQTVSAVETGPVERKWGLGWDSGLTARLWLGGVWELGLAAGPQDFLVDREGQFYDTGTPPYWEVREEEDHYEERTESGFARLQAGRLVGRRGPLAAVCYVGLQYLWSDTRYSREFNRAGEPEDNYVVVTDYDRSNWTLTLGLRPSLVILDFLTIETAFGLEYRWFTYDRVDKEEYPETGQVRIDIDHDEGNSFNDSGWSGMGSLQFIIWF